MNTYGQATGPAGSPLTLEMREGGEQRRFVPQEPFIPAREPEPVQPATTLQYFTPEEARSRFAEHLPIEATPNDTLLPSDDPRVYTYQMPNGNIYYLPATQEQLQERRTIGEAFDYAMDTLPSRTEVEDALLGAPRAIYDSISRQINGGATYSDMLGTATGMVGANVVPRSRFTDELLDESPAEGPNDYTSEDYYEAYDEELDTDFTQWQPEPEVTQPAVTWQQYQDPNYDGPMVPEWEQALQFIDQGGVVDEDGNPNWEQTAEQANWEPPTIPQSRPSTISGVGDWVVNPVPLREGKKPNTGASPLYPPREYQTNYTPENTIVFRSPVRDIIAGMQVPSQGIKGSQFIKMLQDNPSVRNSEVSYLNMGIVPEARYSREELEQLFTSRVPQVEAYLTNEFENYQRQKVGDDLVDYAEIVIDATPQEGAGFIANNQHYGDNTLAHTRASIYKGDSGNYLLVEEMQSDLIQQGWREPVKKTQTGEPALSYIEFIDQQYPNLTDKDRYPVVQSIIESGPEDLLSGAMTTDSIARYVANNWPEGVDRPERYTDIYYAVSDYIDYYSYKRSLQDTPEYNNPPIRSTQESTRLLVESLISYADRNNVNEIVFPPLERIAAERFRPGTKDYEKALTPGSGFHQTYVTSLKKVLQEFQNEFGRNSFPVYRRELPYEARSTPTMDFEEARWMWNDLALIRNRYQNAFPEEGTDQINQRVADSLNSNVNIDGNETLLDTYISLFGNDFMSATNVNELYELNANMGGKIRNLPTDGVAINIGALREQYNLNYPRFAEGGLVTQTKQAFGGMI